MAQRSPGMLKVLVAEVSVTVRAATRGSRLAIGMWFAARVDEICVDLVADDDPVAFEGQVGQAREFRRGQHATARVVRIAEEQHAGVRRRGAHGVEVEDPAFPVAHERVGHERPPGVLEGPQERRIDRQLDHDAVARGAVRLEGEVHALDDVGERVDQLDVRAPPVARGHPLAEDGGEIRLLGVEGVAEVVALQRLAHDGADRLGDRIVELGHPRRQHVGGVALPLLAAVGAQQGGVQRLEIHGRRHGFLRAGL